MPIRRPALAGPRPALRVVRSDAAADAVELLVYDYIGWGGVEAAAVKRELQAITAGTIHLRVNSPGGDVFDGVAIANALKEHPAKVVAHIDALAASIATIIALAADEVEIAPNAFFMIHHPWSFTVGNAADHRRIADTLDKIGGTLLRAYADATGEDDAKVREWMDRETWFTADEAVELGFADRVAAQEAEEDVAEDAVAALAAFDLGKFRHAPAALVARATPPATDPEAPAAPTPRRLERALRDAGLSRREAARLVAQYTSTAPRDAAREPSDDTVTACERVAALFTR